MTTMVPLDTEDEVRAFLRLCLDPGPGRDKRTVARVAEIMPDWLAGPLNEHAPHLAALCTAVHQAEAAAAAARATRTEALRAWIAGETQPTGTAGTPSPRAVTRHSPAPIRSRHLDSFAENAENASTEAIQEHIAARPADRRAMDQHIAFLDLLLTQRAQQIAAGTWPAPDPQHDESETR